MVKGPLVDRYVAAGKEFLSLLDNANVDPRAALWLHRPEDDTWALLLALPAARHPGSKFAYELIQKVFSQHRGAVAPLSFDDIIVVPPNFDLIHALRQVIATGPGIHEIRFTNNTVNGRFVDDAVIYRVT